MNTKHRMDMKTESKVSQVSEVQFIYKIETSSRRIPFNEY